MKKLFRYAGGKTWAIEFINSLKIKSEIYSEQFLGSGQLFLNIEKEFEQYKLNDIDSNIVCMFNAVKNSSFYEYHKMVKFSKLDQRNVKEEYYKFRQFFNENLLNDNDNPEKGLALIILSNTCINSMFRFGPNGFNQGYGNKNCDMLNLYDFEYIKSRIKRAEIKNHSFELYEKNTFNVIDPPYINTGIKYQDKFSENDLKFIIDSLNTLDEYVYFDYANKINSSLVHSYKRHAYNISPNRVSNKIKIDELIFTNIK